MFEANSKVIEAIAITMTALIAKWIAGPSRRGEGEYAHDRRETGRNQRYQYIRAANGEPIQARQPRSPFAHHELDSHRAMSNPKPSRNGAE